MIRLRASNHSASAVIDGKALNREGHKWEKLEFYSGFPARPLWVKMVFP
jgi:hypothetical protein